MNKSILDFNEKIENEYKSVNWWEGKRILYNVVVSVAFLLPSIMTYNTSFMQVFASNIFEYLFNMGYWLVGANILYCLGLGVEFSIQYYRGKKSEIIRNLLFYPGLIFSALWSFFSAMQI